MSEEWERLKEAAVKYTYALEDWTNIAHPATNDRLLEADLALATAAMEYAGS